MPASSSPRHVAVHVQGVVQGVGFRPFVYRIATAHELTGWVRNGLDGVRIQVRGSSTAVDAFLADLRDHAPPQASIRGIDIREIEPGGDGCDRPGDAGGGGGGGGDGGGGDGGNLAAQDLPAGGGFQILESEAGQQGSLSIPADLAMCADCASEIADPAERRHGYPFTNCTQCGPRYTIIAGLPYDRSRTAMKHFELCPECSAEYADPRDRRFHAQPIACPRCGPRLELLGPTGEPLAAGQAALDLAVRALRAGEILALKGLGGFQLLVDATSSPAVARLRERKRRGAKPFAVMFPSTEALRSACAVSAAEEECLSGSQAPIVLVARRGHEHASGRGHDPAPEPWADLVPEVAPDNPRVGAMLPYTPLHRLLATAIGRPLVCTSGNPAEEPMCTRTREALDRLGGVADWYLVHDRPILRPVDDSIGRVGPQGFELLRRARGYAPLPVPLAEDGPAVLALGSHLKATITLAHDRQAILSQHLGDLDSAEAVLLLEQTVSDLLEFHGVAPDVVACDLHPDYASTRLAERLAARWQIPLVRVQHHHAHAAAVVAEHGLKGEVLALAWDGTGLGTDGTIWGGEALLLAGAEFGRIAALRPFRLPGGDGAAREPRRTLLGLLAEIGAIDFARGGDFAWGGDLAGGGFIVGDGTFVGGAAAALARWFQPAELATLGVMLDRGINSPIATSMGRLFDAIAALSGLHGRSSFEGQAAMALEFAADIADPALGAAAYSLPLGVRSTPWPAVGPPSLQADWEPLLREAIADMQAGATVAVVAARFHLSLAELAVAIAQGAGIRQVALAGGCFQNLRLSTLVRGRLEAAGFEVFAPRAIPPNDGGIALGQALVAMRSVPHGVSGSSRGACGRNRP